LINTSSKDLNSFPRIVLSQKKILPYSFFQYIIVNKTEYEKGQIDYELIIHEQAHCQQYHSIDILFIEIIKIIFWFNPIIWILKKEMQLNHEYLADTKVLQTKSLKSYQDILLNLVFRNNSTYLASNFNYSLTKKRLIMMTKNNSPDFDINLSFIL
jgi:bla regulator protein BlaR1